MPTLSGEPHARDPDREPPKTTGSRPFGEIISIRPAHVQETTEALRESEARLQALLSSLDDLVFELDQKGVYLAIWTTDETLLVAPPSELLGRNVCDALGVEVGRRVTRALARVLETGRPEILEYCLDVQAGARWFQCRLARIAGSGSPTVCLLVRDVTAQKFAEQAREDAERRLRYQALHDALTGLPNRVFLSDRLDLALKQSRRKHEELVVLMLDLDGFKDVNDTLGHSAGDEVLREVSRRLASVTRDGDSVGRFGGDEFAVVLPKASEDDGRDVSRRIAQALLEPIAIGKRLVSVDVSIGLAVFPRDASSAEGLIRRADIAMYTAKSDKRGGSGR